ncbi:MAG: hypothetical protein PHE89_05545 [Alphaproteobacteria bacterium]|nr:hypothetical protein [Alphaproteobacteria bacterium]
MRNNKIYLEGASETLNELENRYNFLQQNISYDKKWLNAVCLNKTKDIAKLKKKELNPIKLEKLLRAYRDYAKKTFD